METQEKLELFKEKGFTYNPETGDILGVTGNKIIRVTKKGYINCGVWLNKYHPSINVLGHILGWYLFYNKIPDFQIDHINGDKSDNKISNLRLSTNQENQFNRNDVKGYTWDKSQKKWRSKIMLNGKTINLGRFSKETDARNAYLRAKDIYHQRVDKK